MLKINSKDARSELPKPLYAAAGAGDLAYQQLRRLPEVADRTVRTAKAWRQRINLSNETVGGRVRESAQRGRSVVRATASAAQERAAAGYRSLVARGEKVIAERSGRAEGDAPTKVEVIVGDAERSTGSGEAADPGHRTGEQPN